MIVRNAKFGLGDVVRHRLFPFRGVVVDVDPEFANTEEWYESIPENVRPSKDQPFYHLLAENDDSYYGAYVSEGNLLPDSENGPVAISSRPARTRRTDGASGPAPTHSCLVAYQRRDPGELRFPVDCVDEVPRTSRGMTVVRGYCGEGKGGRSAPADP
jgi:heat shock protein HspQ